MTLLGFVGLLGAGLCFTLKDTYSQNNANEEKQLFVKADV
jgi:uncharacterized protein YlxW (UPF0749 family)